MKISSLSIYFFILKHPKLIDKIIDHYVIALLINGHMNHFRKFSKNLSILIDYFIKFGIIKLQRILLFHTKFICLRKVSVHVSLKSFYTKRNIRNVFVNVT